MQEGNQLGCQDDGESNEGESRRAVVISGMSCRLAVTSESDASFSLSFSSEGKQGNRAATSWCRLRCEAPLKRRERMLQIKGSSRALTFPFLSLTRARLSLTITILFLSLACTLSSGSVVQRQSSLVSRRSAFQEQLRRHNHQPLELVRMMIASRSPDWHPLFLFLSSEEEHPFSPQSDSRFPCIVSTAGTASAPSLPPTQFE